MSCGLKIRIYINEEIDINVPMEKKTGGEMSGKWRLKTEEKSALNLSHWEMIDIDKKLFKTQERNTFF